MLIPMGAARLRISAFPLIGPGEDAVVWTPPPALRFPARASHCWQGDTVAAVADGVLPSSSGDRSIPRLTFWNHRGTTEWVEAEFAAAREVSRVALYWFDDRDGGGCRVPARWRLLARHDGGWTEVAQAGEGALDRFDTIDFPTRTTGALRVEIDLQDGFSAGILEWQIE